MNKSSSKSSKNESSLIFGVLVTVIDVLVGWWVVPQLFITSSSLLFEVACLLFASSFLLWIVLSGSVIAVVNTRVLDEQKRDFDERISLCKREMTSEMVEKQGEIQEVLVGLAVAMTEPERTLSLT
jgi:hypothetical protein